DERQHGRSRSCSRVALYLNEIEREKEKQTSQGAIEKQRQEIRSAEISHAKQTERKQRRAAVHLNHDECGQCTSAHHKRADHSRILPPKLRGFDQRIDDAAKSDRRQPGSKPVEPPTRVNIPAFGHVPERQKQYDKCERN